MSTHITDEKLFQSWEATPEPSLGKPSRTTILEEDADGSYLLWNSVNQSESIKWDGPVATVEQ